MIERIETAIPSGARQYLYHWTSTTALPSIVNLGAVSQTEWDVAKGPYALKKGWVSFTRDKDYAVRGKNEYGGSIRLTFDGDKLAARYKIQPAVGYFYMNSKDETMPKGGQRRIEAEEVILGPVYLKHGLVAIEGTPEAVKNINKSRDVYTEHLQSNRLLLEMRQKGIPLTFEIYRDHGPPATMERVEQKMKNEPNWQPKWFNVDTLSKRCAVYEKEVKTFEKLRLLVKRLP